MHGEHTEVFGDGVTGKSAGEMVAEGERQVGKSGKVVRNTGEAGRVVGMFGGLVGGREREDR